MWVETRIGMVGIEDGVEGESWGGESMTVQETEKRKLEEQRVFK